MKKLGVFMGVALLASSPLMAKGIDTQAKAKISSSSLIETLPEKGPVHITGVVSEVEDQKEFTLQDRAGKTIDVETRTETHLTKGDRVRVSGSLDQDLWGMFQSIENASVDVLSSDKVTSFNSPENKFYRNIAVLPDEGPVSLYGTVISVDLEDREFILKDSQGESIDVQTRSLPTVKVGDRVKVSGSVQSELAGFGEEIVARQIAVISQR
jgi:uncharacterized protein YdeI (BOF family)